MNVRAKMVVTGINAWPGYPQSRKIQLDCIYDQNIPEDQRFFKATPSGKMEMQVDNPTAVAALELGQAFYVELTPVPAA